MNIHSQNIILTGAASGIGKALLEKLNQFKGIKLLAVDIQEDLLKEVINQLPKQFENKIVPYEADLSKMEEIDDLFDFAVKMWGKVDIFIANAGFAYYELVEDPDWGHIERIFQLNVFSPLYSFMRLKKINSERPYYFLATSSAMAKLAVPGYALYAATKAALYRFEDGYRYEPKDKGVFGLVYPIATRSAFFQASSDKVTTPTPFPSQSPEQVAQAMLGGILRNKRSIYPSRIFYISLLPQLFFEWISKPYQIYYAGVLKKYFVQ